MIVVLDYGMGNVGSIINMLKKIGEKAIVSNDKDTIEKANKIILPGVGAFDMGMKQLEELGLTEIIKNHAIKNAKPLLGICLGMQLLGRKSEEGVLPGLGLIPFDNVRLSFNDSLGLKIPHMGWDRAVFVENDVPLLNGLESPQRYYFVHSYLAVCDLQENSIMECDYGYKFTVAVQKANIYGVQFHPEKSHSFGMEILKNFVERC